MANPATTHVVEIEAGIGEPAFIPLSSGQELQPISVGKKGMWRIESPRVLDVHAFLYFDGTSLFLQSADENNAASVDGYRVGKAWTELHAPCKIEVGHARLRFRSLIADPGGQPDTRTASTKAQGEPRPGASIPAAVAPPAPQGRKAERPFKPGAFAGGHDLDEATRVAPLDSNGAGRGASSSHPRPGANQPVTGQATGEAQGARQDGRAMMSGAFPAVQGASGHYAPMGRKGAPMQSGTGAYPGAGMPPQRPFSGYPNASGSGAFNVMQGGMPPIPGPPGMPGQLGPGAYGSITAQGGMLHPGDPQSPVQAVLAKLKANSIPKIVAGILFLIGGILYLAEDDEPVVQTTPNKASSATRDAGTGGGSVTASGAPTTPPVMPIPATPTVQAWPPGVPCPPPNWPLGTPLPCAPNGAIDRDKSARDTGAKGEPKDGGAGLPAGTKTLERQAVDDVASGETAKAAADYEALVRRDPSNTVYAEAARILRAKLDGGVPAP